MLHLGQTQAALACLEEAQPHFHRDINLLNQIAIALQRLERFDEAADWYEKALAIMPNHAEITSNLGNARMRAGQYEQALALFERAHAKGGHVVARVNQALALHHLGRGEQADGIVEEVRARRPLQVPVLNAIAHFHRMRRRPEQAVQVLRQVLALDPASCHALAHLATVALDFGRFAEAETMYRRALHMHPQLTEALAQIPKMRKMTPADDWWLRGVEPILAGSLPSREEADLRYALAKYYDDIGDYPAAYDQGVRANALQKNRQKPYDPAAYERRVGRTIEITGAEEIGRALSGANQSDRPVLIVGMPRSGTSLAEQIVASHPDAYGAGELSYWGESLRGLVPDSRMEDLPDGPIQTLADSYLAHLNEFDSRAKRVTDKMPGNFFLAGFIHRIFPNARIIHMRRDPRDVCLSIFFQSFNDRHEYATDLNDLAHYYRQYLRITAHWRAVLPSDRFMEVRYEDLIADQETWTRRILDFIGLPWDDRCLRFHETDRKVGTASNWQVRQKIYKSSAARWKRYEQFLGPLADLAREEGLED
jgi:tetratricopeptide (TPR) repeat protein